MPESSNPKAQAGAHETSHTPLPRPELGPDMDSRGHTIVRMQLNTHELALLERAVFHLVGCPGIGEEWRLLQAKLRGVRSGLETLIKIYGKSGRVEPEEG